MPRKKERLDAFTAAYIEALLFSTTDESDESGGEPLDKNYSASDIAPETMELIVEDCADFQERFGRLIEDDESADIDKWGRWELAGHDFWLTREGHGAGFWDGGWPKHGDELTEAAKSYGGFDVTVGDDGLIYGPNPDYYRNPPEWLAKRHPSLARPRTPREAREASPHRRYPPRSRRTGRQHTARDFSTIPEIVQHEQKHGGASHVLVGGRGGVWIFYPEGGGKYSVSQLWQERGYWHSPAPAERMHKRPLDPKAEPIDAFLGHARRGLIAFEARERHGVQDYIAVGPSGRHIAGPFKDYDKAKREADRAGGYVQFAVGEVGGRSPRGGATKRISSRAPQMTADAVMKLATELSRKVGGTKPKVIQGGHRWSDRNESAYFVTYSPEYNQTVVVLVSIFQDGTIALDFFSSENMSELDRYENIVHFLYSTADLGEMQADLKWVWETVDGYAESWGADRDRTDVDEARRNPPAPAPHMLPPTPAPFLLPPGPSRAKRPAARPPSARRRAARK